MDTKVYRIGGESLAQSTDMWEFVRHGLERVKARIGNRSDWQPLHVRQSIERNASELWVVFEDNQPVGFYVLTVVVSPFTNVPQSMWVWICYGQPGKWKLIEAHLADVEVRAKQLGIDNIEFMSPRKGWLKRLTSLGFEVAEIIHRKKV